MTEDQIQALRASILQRWGNSGDWNAQGKDRALELARLMAANGISDLDKLGMSLEANPGFYDAPAGLTARERAELGVDRNHNIKDFGSLTYDGQKLGYLGTVNTGGGLAEIGQAGPMPSFGRESLAGWSSDGHGQMNFAASLGPDGKPAFRPEWGSSSNADEAQMVAKYIATVLTMGAAAGWGAGAEAAGGLGAEAAGGLSAGEAFGGITTEAIAGGSGLSAGEIAMLNTSLAPVQGLSAAELAAAGIGGAGGAAAGAGGGGGGLLGAGETFGGISTQGITGGAGLSAEQLAMLNTSLAPAQGLSAAELAAAGVGSAADAGAGAGSFRPSQNYGPGMSGTQTSTYDSIIKATGSPGLANLGSEAVGGLQSAGNSLGNALGGSNSNGLLGTVSDWGKVIAPIAGAIDGAKGQPGVDQTTTRKLDPRIDSMVFGADGKGGLLGDMNAWYQANKSGQNDVMRLASQRQQQMLTNPEVMNGLLGMGRQGISMMNAPIASNPFSQPGNAWNPLRPYGG